MPVLLRLAFMWHLGIETEARILMWQALNTQNHLLPLDAYIPSQLAQETWQWQNGPGSIDIPKADHLINSVS